MEEIEIWKDIPGLEQFFQVSDFGRIKRKETFLDGTGRGFPKTIKEKILKPISMGGYLGFNIRNKKKMYVHRAVALAFIPNPDNKSDVNHKDGNKLNNVLSNLEWCTRKENMRHAFDNGLVGYRNPSNKKRVKISKDGFEKVFECIEYAAKFIGVCGSGVSRACSGEKQHAGGYKCEFI